MQSGLLAVKIIGKQRERLRHGTQACTGEQPGVRIRVLFSWHGQHPVSLGEPLYSHAALSIGDRVKRWLKLLANPKPIGDATQPNDFIAERQGCNQLRALVQLSRLRQNREAGENSILPVARRNRSFALG